MQYQPNMTFANYRLIQRIDAGGEAEVWKAIDTSNNLTRALKLRPPVQFDDRDAFNDQVGRLESEKRSWQEFTQGSIYIVTLFDAFSIIYEEKQVEYVINGIVSELSEIGDLETHLINGETRAVINSELRFIEFIRHVINGVSAGHRFQRIHCDIKPKNILLYKEPDGTLVPKIMDFGISRAMYETIAGKTPGYSAPELTHSTAPTIAADVYSLGITLYEIMYFCFSMNSDPTLAPEHFRSGELFKAKLNTSGVLENDPGGFPAKKYLQLFEAMTAEAPADRIPLNEVSMFLETQHRIAAGNSNRYRVKVSPNLYHWHTHVHKAFDEQLYLVFAKGGAPVRDLQYFKRDLEIEGVQGFSIYSVAGEWDYILRLWLHQATTQRVFDVIRRTCRESVVLQVEEFEYNKKAAGRVANMSDIALCRAIETSAGGKDEYRQLKDRNFILSKIDTSKKKFRVFVIVEIKEDRTPLDRFYAQMMRDSVKKFDEDAADISVYLVQHHSGPSKNKDAKLVFKFTHKNFLACRETLMDLYNQFYAYGDRFSFSTLFHMAPKQDILSDDGQIRRRIGELLAGTLGSQAGK